MRKTLGLTLLLVPLSASIGLAAPVFDATVADAGPYTVDVTKAAVGANWEYQWKVTFVGASVFGSDDPDGDPIQRWRAFVVYDPTGNDGGVVGWLDTSNPTWIGGLDGAPALLEWSAFGNLDRRRTGDTLTFTATLDRELVDPTRTAIHVQYGEDSEWVTNTPELPPSLLSVLGFGGIALMRRFRRRLRH